MNLSIKELNEVIYCIGRVIAEDKNGYNSEFRQQIFDRLYSELEGRMDQIQQTIDELND